MTFGQLLMFLMIRNGVCFIIVAPLRLQASLYRAPFVRQNGEYLHEIEKEKLISTPEKCGIKEWEPYIVDNRHVLIRLIFNLGVVHNVSRKMEKP
ncbi:hypothetical protein IFM89_039031 [Coptis chinensis]|uniref:Uncharacterized protein n=1 Tax=Coptis chinensis TaxID=261450 RepID=A0A835IIK8_9MAGN|nr:hypothetical protein IFM89_039031 [Coptis chinensis]